jgi:hypothetical protein
MGSGDQVSRAKGRVGARQAKAARLSRCSTSSGWTASVVKGSHGRLTDDPAQGAGVHLRRSGPRARCRGVGDRREGAADRAPVPPARTERIQRRRVPADARGRAERPPRRAPRAHTAAHARERAPPLPAPRPCPACSRRSAIPSPACCSHDADVAAGRRRGSRPLGDAVSRRHGAQRSRRSRGGRARATRATDPVRRRLAPRGRAHRRLAAARRRRWRRAKRGARWTAPRSPR